MESSIRGASITTPHKDSAALCATRKDEITDRSKSANTLIFDENNNKKIIYTTERRSQHFRRSDRPWPAR